MANYLNPNLYSFLVSPLSLDSKSEVNKVSKEILSLAPTSIPTENLFVNANPAPISQGIAVPVNPSISKVNTSTPVVIPGSEKVSAPFPDIESTNTGLSAVKTPITYDISRQVAANQAGFGVNLSPEAQKSINSLNVNAVPNNKTVKTEEVMNGRIFLSEMKTQEEIKNIFVVPNLIKTFETLATNLDSKKRSEGFSFNKGNDEKQSKQKNSLNVSI